MSEQPVVFDFNEAIANLGEIGDYDNLDGYLDAVVEDVITPFVKEIIRSSNLGTEGLRSSLFIESVYRIEDEVDALSDRMAKLGIGVTLENNRDSHVKVVRLGFRAPSNPPRALALTSVLKDQIFKKLESLQISNTTLSLKTQKGMNYRQDLYAINDRHIYYFEIELKYE